MNNEIKQAILLAIDALESCDPDATFIDGDYEWQEAVFDEDKVKAALKALQALELET